MCKFFLSSGVNTMKNLAIGAFILATSLNLFAFPVGGAINQSTLNIQVDGFRNKRGQVCLSLFASSKGFPDSRANAVKAKCVKISETPMVITLNNLKVGNYAVALFHDANGDGQLNRNSLGIPTEEFGFSQNPAVITGVPRFSDSAVLVAGSTNIQIRLRNLLG